MSKNLKLWAPFAITSLMTVLTYKCGYAIPGWVTLLTCLAFLSLFFGILVIRHTELKFWSIATVIGGLVIGQWWLIQYVIVIAFMKCRGFAP